MFTEVLIGTLLLLFGIAVIVFGDKKIKSADSTLSRLFTHKKSTSKVVKWVVGIVSISFGIISFQTPESLYWAGLVEWTISFFCLSMIAFRNSVWFSTSKSVFSNLSIVDVKFAKWAGLFFGIGSVLFIIGITK